MQRRTGEMGRTAGQSFSEGQQGLCIRKKAGPHRQTGLLHNNPAPQVWQLMIFIL